ILCAPERIGDEDNRLQATIDWPRIVLDRPWRWQTGGPDPARLELSGDLDLSEGSPTATAEAEPTATGCAPPQPGTQRGRAQDPGAARAQVQGAVDMAVLAELLGSDALRRARGRIDVDLALQGPGAETTTSGRVTVPEAAEGSGQGLELDVGELGLLIRVSTLEHRIDGYWPSAQGPVQLVGEPLRFGT